MFPLIQLSQSVLVLRSSAQQVALQQLHQHLQHLHLLLPLQ
jgi:hypothetical protein